MATLNHIKARINARTAISVPPERNHLKALNVFSALGRRIRLSWIRGQARIWGPIVDGDARKKDRRRKVPGVSKRMNQAVDNDAAGTPGESQGVGPDNGLSLTLQAHIGRHVRAVFDEVAREPIPEHLLRLLKDLEQSGEK